MNELETWGGRKKFSYSGSVEEGTTIYFGHGRKVSISKEDYHNLLKHFHGRTVNIGTSRTCPPKDSMGKWLIENVNKMALASYVGSILVKEGYAVKIKGPEIMFK